MALGQITYLDKDNTLPLGTARRMVSDSDMNEIKNVVNGNASLMAFKPIPWDPPSTPEAAALPNTGGLGENGEILHGQMYWWTATGYVPGESEAVEEWRRKTISIALVDNPGNDPANWRHI